MSSALRAELLAAARELAAKTQSAEVGGRAGGGGGAAGAAAKAPEGPPAAHGRKRRYSEEGGGGGQQGTSSGSGSAAGVSCSGAARAQGGSSEGWEREEGPSSSSSSVPPSWASHNALLEGCRNVTVYKPIRCIDQGTYGRVFLAEDRETGESVALKQIKFESTSQNEGFPVTALREVGLLLSLHHPNIIRTREVVVGRDLDKVYMVMDYMPHNMRDFLERLPPGAHFTQGEVKCLLGQLLAGLAHTHSHWVMHRDLKTANLLISPSGRLTLCDYGLARTHGHPPRPLTPSVVTLWYRPPEVLLGLPTYDFALDLWAVGCIFAEFLTREPLFPARSEGDALALIFSTLGTPSGGDWPGWRDLPNVGALRAGERNHPPRPLRDVLRVGGGSGSGGGGSSGPMAYAGRPQLSDAGLHLLTALLQLNPQARITAEEALEHPWFKEYPPPCDPRLLPAFPSTK